MSSEMDGLAMSQHFLLSAKARTLSLAKVARMSEEEAAEAFKPLVGHWRRAYLSSLRLPRRVRLQVPSAVQVQGV